jgi:hypothetical protein
LNAVASFFNALKAPMENNCPYSNKQGPIWLFLHHGVLFDEILHKSKYKAIDALGIELPFLALAVETTKPL